MKLVEAESTGPVEGEEAVVTPPRPPHRRVSVSLLFTLTVLVGTVVAIYVVFPARNEVVLKAAFDRHAAAPAWDLAAPTGAEARAWAWGVVGRAAPLPQLDAPVRVIGVQRIELLDHPAAVMRIERDGVPMTYVVQTSRDGAVVRVDRDRDGLHGVAWRGAGFTTAAVGARPQTGQWFPLLPH